MQPDDYDRPGARRHAGRAWSWGALALATALALIAAACSGESPAEPDVADPVVEDVADVDDTNEDVDDADVDDMLAEVDSEALEAALPSVGLSVDPSSLRCDADADLAVGAEITCEFTRNGQPVRLVASVDGIDGAAVDYDVRLEALASPAEVIADSVARTVSLRDGGADTDATCTGDLAPEVDATTECTVSRGDGSTTDVVVRVDEVVDGEISYELEETGS